MLQTDRGPERRKQAQLTSSDKENDDNFLTAERRINKSDRREFGFISTQRLYQNTSYYQIEPILRNGDKHFLSAGDILLYPGQANKHFYLVKSGQLKVMLKNHEETGSYFVKAGEYIGAINEQSAYVVANKDSEIIILHGELFFQQFAILPEIARNLLLLAEQRFCQQRKVALKKHKLILLANELDEINLGYLNWNIETDEVYTNKSFLSLLGYNKSILENKSKDWIKLMHTEDSVHFFSIESEKFKSKVFCHELEFRIRHKNGNWIWVHCCRKIEFDRFGDPVHICGIHNDITNMKHSEEKLQEEKEYANAKNIAKGKFLSMISHEIGNPLNAIVGYAQLIELTQGTKEIQKEYAGEILSAANHLLSLTKEILELSHIESGKVKLQLEPIPLESVVSDCLKLINIQAKKNNIRIHHNLESFADISVLATSIQLKQIVLNLLSNAVKYNKQSGEIRLNCEVTDNSRVRLTVSDTGLGLSTQQMDKLFTPFDRLGREHSNIEGTGIGIVITKHLVESMGGKLGVSSIPNKGSNFWFELNMEASDVSLSIE